MIEQAHYRAILPNSTNHLHGEVILPHNTGYEAARKVWNGMVDKYPALIVRCAEQADVIQCYSLRSGSTAVCSRALWRT
jgi:hypothetical protein